MFGSADGLDLARDAFPRACTITWRLRLSIAATTPLDDRRVDQRRCVVVDIHCRELGSRNLVLRHHQLRAGLVVGDAGRAPRSRGGSRAAPPGTNNPIPDGCPGKMACPPATMLLSPRTRLEHDDVAVLIREGGMAEEVGVTLVAGSPWCDPRHPPLRAAVIGGLLLAVSGATLGQEPRFDLEAMLARVGAQLERRYQRSQRIVSTEMVWVRSFAYDMRPNESPRRLEFERRVEWGTSEEDGVPNVRVFRELRSVNGREPRQRDLDACLTPMSETEDPLSVLLPARQRAFEFSLGELNWIDGRRVARLDYVAPGGGPRRNLVGRGLRVDLTPWPIAR